MIRPDETLAMSYIYLNKYKRFQQSSPSPDPLDPYVCLSSSLKTKRKEFYKPQHHFADTEPDIFPVPQSLLNQ